MTWREVILLVVVGSSICGALTPSTYLTVADTTRLKTVFNNALPFSDLTTSYYAILGYSLLGEKITAAEDPCKFINSKIDSKSLESLFFGTSASKLLGNCKINSVSNLQQVLESALKEESSMHDIYYAVLSLKNMGVNFDSAKVAKILTSALKKDDSVMNLGLAFHVASKLKGDVTSFFERIEDAIVQADEVDGKYLQFEGGLGITSTTISGMYHLAEAVNKTPAVTSEQAVKFTNYFLSRKFVQTVKGAAQLLDILRILATNKFHIPVAITIASNSALSEQNPSVQVRITNVLGASLGPLTVVTESATRLGDDAVVMSKKTFQPVKGSDVLYSLNFLESVDFTSSALRGFYKISIKAIPTKADPRLVGNTGARIDVKVMTEVVVENAEIGTIDRDQATSAKSVKVQYPKQTETKLEADYHQKILMKFTLKDKNAKSTMVAHQAFVQFISKEKEEIIFVAEPDSSDIYRFDLDIYSKAKEFDYASGVYEVSLIVGDAVIMNPFVWKVGEISLTFPVNPNPPKTAENPFIPKPEIRHLFREQEKRPSSIVSNTFTGLVVVPLLIMFIMWFKLGANLSNFPFSLSAILFHIGLGAIFVLFGLFWLKLNMFTTLKYLSIIGTVTFLSGHNLLNRLATMRK